MTTTLAQMRTVAIAVQTIATTTAMMVNGNEKDQRRLNPRVSWHADRALVFSRHSSPWLKRKIFTTCRPAAKASKSSDIVIDADEAADLLADAREFYGDAFLAEAKAKADAVSEAMV